MECARCGTWYAPYMPSCPFCNPAPRIVLGEPSASALRGDSELAAELRLQKYTRGWALATDGGGFRMLGERVTVLSEEIWRHGAGPSPPATEAGGAGPLRTEGALRRIVGIRLRAPSGRINRIWEVNAYSEIARGQHSRWLARVPASELYELPSCVGVIGVYSRRFDSTNGTGPKPRGPIDSFREFARHLVRGKVETR